MGTETFNYIDSLNTANPTSTDNVSEGDDHIRGIKTTLKNTFPNLDGAVNATDTELNYVDGVTSAIQTQLDAALPLAGGAMTGAITTNSTFDTRDVATDGTKLDGIETSADVTDATNVTAAGALMDSEVTNLADVKAFDTTDYATAAQGTTADAALPKAGGTMAGDLTMDANDINLADNGEIRFGASNDLAIWHDGSHSIIEDTGTGNLYIKASNNLLLRSATNEDYLDCTANGAVRLYHDNSVKLATTSSGIDVTGVITTDGLTTSADISFGDNDKATFGASDDLKIYHDGSNSYVYENGTGDLRLRSNGANVSIQSDGGENLIVGTKDGAVDLYHNNSKKLETLSTGVYVTGAARGTLTTDNDGSFDMSASNNFKCTPSGDFTLTFTNILSQSGFILLVNSGGHTVSAHANSKVDANLLATVTAAGTYLISYFSDGTNVYLTNSAIYT